MNPETTANLNSLTEIKKPELLSPAGDYQAFLGAINAGADAVYLAGNQYGARAYANNFTEEELLSALDYAHVHGKKIYLTVNTITKNKELKNLASFLEPFYLAGLDGVIVQDLGVFHYIKEVFPDLHQHVSTQMTITSVYGASLLKEMGATRIVPARELTLEEIKSINALGIETECFIHGSMCYAYSGQCLFSSFLGGRSGNRGRCAGPCRQPYSLTKNGKEQYPISLKDLCTLHILPKLIDAGISSFKIEGRMKAPAYAAGTAKIYRKYIDLYYDKSREYKVEDNDLKDLYGLYLRSDLQEGYYEKVKGKEMVSLHSPSYNKTNEELCNQITESFCRRQIPVILNASAKIVAGENASINISMPDGNLISVNGELVDVAKKAPLTEESLKERFMKSSEGLYAFRLNEICLGDGNAFLPVGAINALRRNAESILQNKLRENYQDRRIVEDYSLTDSVSGIDDNETTVSYRYFVTTLEQFHLSLAYAKEGDGICIPASFMEIPLVLDTLRKEYSQDILFYIVLPAIIREGNMTRLKKNLDIAESMPEITGYYCNQADSLALIHSIQTPKTILSDYSVHCTNNETIKVMGEYTDGFTISPELSYDEMKNLTGLWNGELWTYGRIPLMQSANCILNTLGKCQKAADPSNRSDFHELIDRKNVAFTFFTHCDEKVCYNTLYNSVPQSLHRHFDKIKSLSLQALQLRFSNESAKEAKEVLKLYDNLRNGNASEVSFAYTNGHFVNSVL
ncbi:MAG: U32 family peptidase [Lachnospiraceae bacterium]|nr:U32 family peptidase [Lachnospiraceae bacterium]